MKYRVWHVKYLDWDGWSLSWKDSEGIDQYPTETDYEFDFIEHSKFLELVAAGKTVIEQNERLKEELRNLFNLFVHNDYFDTEGGKKHLAKIKDLIK